MYAPIVRPPFVEFCHALCLDANHFGCLPSSGGLDANDEEKVLGLFAIFVVHYHRQRSKVTSSSLNRATIVVPPNFLSRRSGIRFIIGICDTLENLLVLLSILDLCSSHCIKLPLMVYVHRGCLSSDIICWRYASCLILTGASVIVLSGPSG